MKFTGEMERELTDNNLEMFVNGVKCVADNYDPIYDNYTGQEFNLDDVLTIKPITSAYILNDTGNYVTDFILNAVWNFEISDDKKTGSLTINGAMLDGVTRFYFATIPAPIVVPPDDENPIDNIKRGINNVYLLDEVTARKVMKERFDLIVSSGNGDSGASIKVIDVADRIIGLINIPFVVDSKYQVGKENVYLADYNTNLQATVLNSDTIIINMGSISVPHVNNNLLDYLNVKAVLNLPYSAPINLEVNDVIGYELKIEYWIDVYNGECMIKILSTKTNSIIESKRVDLGVNVPFNKLGTVPSNNSFNSIDSTGYNGINTPFIEIKTYDTVLVNALFTNPVIDEKTLIDEEGYIEIENIELTVNATLQEKSDILNLLRQGVIIK